MTTVEVPAGARGALLVVEHFWTWYRRNWRSSAISSVLQPLLMLLSFGLALGTLVRPSPVTGNVPYLVYLAPGLLAAAAVQIAASESSYPVLGGFKWQRVFFAMTATPLTAGQLVAGQIAWIGLRMLLSGAAYLSVIALFGGVQRLAVVASLGFAVLCGLAVSAPIVAFAATVNDEGWTFSSMFRFVILPMTLFAGTFFPVSQLPVWSRPLAWISPLWHGTELARGAALGTLRLLPALGHIGYLSVFVVVGTVLAVWRFRLRLYV